MSSSETALLAKGSRLPAIPEAWARGLALHPGAQELLALAEGLASFLPGREAAPHYDRSVLLFLCLLLAQADGHSGLALDPAEGGTLARLAQAFGADPAVLSAHAATGLPQVLLGGPGAPLVLEHGILYSQRLHRGEVRLAEALRARCQPVTGLGPEPSPAVLALPRPLNERQVLALRMALHAPLTLVTGGPGTGKTSIIVAILREAVRRGLDISRVALAAPTGKAANRMFSSILENLGELEQKHGVALPWAPGELAPSTLHRLLGFQAGTNRFRHTQDQPLPADLVIVDEASMVDLLMMERLFQALRPEARLVLLGDAQQLPSVEAGCVFQDLVASLPHAMVRLTRNYRMDTPEGQPVHHAAMKLAGSEPELLFREPHPILPCAPGNRAPRVDQFEGTPQEVRTFLLDWFHREVEGAMAGETFLERVEHTHRVDQGVWRTGDAERLRSLFERQKQTRILCPVREGSGLRCTAGINALLHREASRERDRKLDHALAVSLGEPVMMTRNDYRRWLFNGDQGLILLVARDGGPAHLEAVFPAPEGGFSAHAVVPILPHLELGYALTVHKAQGSEYQRVVIVLPEEDTPFLSKEILYTALTRAKQVVTIIGSREVILAAAARTLRRTSGLPGRLLAIVGLAHANMDCARSEDRQ